MSFATRGGYSLATHYAVKTIKKFMERVPEEDRAGLDRTRQRLETKILVISPAIDLIQLISARGNTSLSTTVALTRELKEDIAHFQAEMDASVAMEDGEHTMNASEAVARVQESMDELLKRVEEAIPLIQLALTTSGANLSSNLPPSVSPARLLQASDALRTAERVFNASSGTQDVQVGPVFEIKSYTTFSASARDPKLAQNGDITWKEDMARCEVSIWQRRKRGYHYYLRLVENQDDGRYHEDAARVVKIDVSKVTRLFFSASGKLLEIEDAKSPVLVLKINHADLENEDVFSEDAGEEASVEWLALENYRYVESPDEDSFNYNGDVSYDMESEPPTPVKPTRAGAGGLHDPIMNDISSVARQLDTLDVADTHSISLLEYIIRLTALQSNDQESALHITDERLNLYLRDESNTSMDEAPAVQQTRTLSRPIAPDTPAQLGGRQGSSAAHTIMNRHPHLAQPSLTRLPPAAAANAAAPSTPLRTHQFSSYHTPNTKSAWEVDRSIRPSPLKKGSVPDRGA